MLDNTQEHHHMLPRSWAEPRGEEALERLIKIGRGDTGQCGRVRRFLLGLYNGGTFPFDLTDLRCLDHAIQEDCLAVLSTGIHARLSTPSCRRVDCSARSTNSEDNMAKSESQKDNERTIDTLRGLLFDTLEDLRNPDKPMDVDRAKAIKDVAREIIETARVDLKYIELTGYGNGKFIDGPARLEAPDSKKR